MKLISKKSDLELDLLMKSILEYIRGTDMGEKININEMIEKIKKISRTKKIKKIYFATDDYRAKKNFKERLSSNLDIISYTNPYDFKEFREKCTYKEGMPTHYFNPNREEQIDGYFIDLYMLLKSNNFIPSNNSSMSNFIRLMRLFNFSFFDIYERKNFKRRKFLLKIYERVSIFFTPIISLINFTRKLIVRLK